MVGPCISPGVLWYHSGMKTHRLRLTDEDIALLVACLSARLAMATGLRAHRIVRLRSRLLEGAPGNPKWTLGEIEQTHEEDLDLEDLDDS